MKLRRYRKADVEGLVALFTASVHTLAATQYDAEQCRAWAPIPPNIDEWRDRFGALRTIVAVDDDSYLGFISFEKNGHIDLLYTAPSAARRGVASALLREASVQMSGAARTAELFTEASLVAAPFFSRHGFEITEEQNVVRRGVSFRRFAMRKPGDAAQLRS
ncbi:MAG: GNAT family N-acetyltransferase [Betaproteobacteria bacterium HGW-Betaproteobacteria-7]|nr:MAG: GNAT family N-acetyltransferase [Betaproteobacteria bacterium HGW-Betaproteobacteria-7]